MFAPNGVLKDSPGALPGGCTRDLVHRFYQEQYQLDGGKQDRYVTGSDAVGLTMGTYDTRKLPIYEYLHGRRHPDYAISDRFFQAAFGGSFLNHQWLVAAATPTFYGALATAQRRPALPGRRERDAEHLSALHADRPGQGPGADRALQRAAARRAGVRRLGGQHDPADLPALRAGHAGRPQAPAAEGRHHRRPAERAGHRLGLVLGRLVERQRRRRRTRWTNSPTACTDPETAAGAVFPNCPNKLFQYHHQALNYYASFAPGTAARRRHLRDEQEFEDLAADSRRHCRIKPVSIIKPIGAENEHPGYASEHTGSDHLVDLLQSVQRSACAKDTMVIVTYDEFGGQWDHVSPPGQGARTPGPHDEMGPSHPHPGADARPRPAARFSVDHASHDTTSIMATIEHRFGLRPVSSRDAQVQDLSTVFGHGAEVDH